MRYRLNIFIILLFLTIPTLQAVEFTGPKLQIAPSEIDFGAREFNMSDKRSISLTNIGDSVCHIYYIEELIDVFDIEPINLPIILQPNESQDIDFYHICALDDRVDSQKVKIISDSRGELSIALIFDVSESMQEIFADSVKRVDAAKEAGIFFINSMINIGPIVDEAAIYWFALENELVQGYTADKDSLIMSLPEVAPMRSTAVYDALHSSLQDLKSRTNSKIAIILTDGDDNMSKIKPQAVIDLANDNDINIFTISIGNVHDPFLEEIARRTQGMFFAPETPDELIAAYNSIYRLHGEEIVLRGRCAGTTANLIFECSDSVISADPGDTLSLPFNINFSGIIKSNCIGNYRAEIKYNPNVLKALESDKYISSSDSETGLLSIIETGSDIQDILNFYELKFLAMLGDSDSTDVIVNNFFCSDSTTAADFEEALCKIKIQTCRQGGTRLIKSGVRFSAAVFPNPVNDYADLNCSIHEDGFCEINLTDNLGRQCLSVHRGYLKSGYHNFNLDLSHCQSGVYFLNVTTPTLRMTKILNLIK